MAQRAAKLTVLDPASFILKRQTVCGFWLHCWYRAAKPNEITAMPAMLDRLALLVTGATISTPVIATYGLDQCKQEAIAKSTVTWKGEAHEIVNTQGLLAFADDQTVPPRR